MEMSKLRIVIRQIRNVIVGRNSQMDHFSLLHILLSWLISHVSIILLHGGEISYSGNLNDGSMNGLADMLWSGDLKISSSIVL